MKKICIIYGSEIDFSEFYERELNKETIKKMREILLSRIFSLK